MSRKRLILFVVCGTAVSIALMVLALWMWSHADALVVACARPSIAVWAVRSAAVVAAAAAQMVLVAFVANKVYGRDLFGDFVGLLAALIFALSLVGAAALGLAGN